MDNKLNLIITTEIDNLIVKVRYKTNSNKKLKTDWIKLDNKETVSELKTDRINRIKLIIVDKNKKMLYTYKSTIYIDYTEITVDIFKRDLYPVVYVNKTLANTRDVYRRSIMYYKHKHF